MKYEEGARFSVFDFKKDRGGGGEICKAGTKHIHPRGGAGTGAHGQFPRSPASMILLFYFQPCSWTRRARFDPPAPSFPEETKRKSLRERERKKKRKGGWGEAGEDQWTKKVAYGVLQPPKVSQRRKRERRGGYLRLSSWTLTLLSYLMADR